MIYTPSHIKNHPDWNSEKLLHDIAIIELNDTVPLSDELHPACIAPFNIEDLLSTHRQTALQIFPCADTYSGDCDTNKELKTGVSDGNIEDFSNNNFDINYFLNIFSSQSCLLKCNLK